MLTVKKRVGFGRFLRLFRKPSEFKGPKSPLFHQNCVDKAMIRILVMETHLKMVVIETMKNCTKYY